MKAIKFFFPAFLLLLLINGGLLAQTVNKTTISHPIFYVRCDGVIIDVLRGTNEIHFLTHYKDGKVDWYKQEMKDIDLYSARTGEHFIVSFHQKQSGIPVNEKIIEVSIHYNCVGEWGSHYIIEETFEDDFNTTPPTHTIIKQECKCW